MSPSPRVVIGATLYNRAEYLPEALESLLSQTYRDYLLLLVDDGSTDRTRDILQFYASSDDRLIVRHNSSRLGMINNWRRAFEIALEVAPDLEYFAWASDHDVWHPRWLSALVAELDQHPEAILAYPRVLRIADRGEVLRRPWLFDTAGIQEPAERLRLACAHMRAGDMVYGLFRASVLARAGVFRPVLVPDRLLLAELALYGEFRQVPEVLWYRRFENLASVARQRASFFPDGVPAYAYLPYWLQHLGVLLWQLGVRGAGEPEIGRLSGVLLSAAYLEATMAHRLGRAVGRLGKRFRREVVDTNRVRAGRVRRAVERAVRRVRAHTASYLMQPPSGDTRPR